MKVIGKYCSRKLRRVLYYIFYIRDPQKTYSIITFSANIQNIYKFGEIKQNLLIKTPHSYRFKAGSM